MKPSMRDHRLSRASGLILLLAGLALGGCSSGGVVYMRPQDDGNAIEHRFAEAYFTSFTPGEYDIVLLDNAVRPDSQPLDKPIAPTPVAAGRQIIHIHAYWAADSSIHSSPAGVNASISWYTAPLPSASAANWNVREGAGLVILSGGGRERSVDIAEATLRSQDLAEGVPPVRVHGRTTARRNDQRVRDVLAELAESRPATRPAR